MFGMVGREGTEEVEVEEEVEVDVEVEVEGILAAGLSNGMDIKNSSSSSLKKSE